MILQKYCLNGMSRAQLNLATKPDDDN